MFIYKIFEYPAAYNLSQKILSAIAFGNKGMENFLKEYFGGKSGSILDIGCGTGRFAGLFVNNQHCAYTGIDHNPKYIKYCKRKLKGEFLTADAVNFDFAGGKFDYIISMCVFHHLSDEEIKKLAGKMMKIANKEVIIVDPVFPPGINFLGNWLLKLDGGKHVRTFDALNKLLSDMNIKYLRDLDNSFPYRICAFNYKIN
jgi:SAM-dependent methyltransferase